MIVLKALPIVEHTKKILTEWTQRLPRPPTLAVIFVGHNPASQLYINKKKIMAESLGFVVHLFHYDESSAQHDIIEKIKNLNTDPGIDGILIQLPLPKSFDSQELIGMIEPSKDVDGLHPVNQGLLWDKADYSKYFAPCTPLGIMRLLSYYEINLRSQSVLILGRSSLVGKPLAALMLHKNAQLTLCHSLAQPSAEQVKKADIVVLATGSRDALSWNALSEHHVVIDVGTHQLPNGKSCGDLGPLDNNVKIKAYTPVPGGVGPMTVNSLMYNIFKSYCLRSAPTIWADFISEHGALFEPLLTH